MSCRVDPLKLAQSLSRPVLTVGLGLVPPRRAPFADSVLGEVDAAAGGGDRAVVTALMVTQADARIAASPSAHRGG